MAADVRSPSDGVESPTLNSFFSVEQRNDRWWFFTPSGEPFWSIGMNHIDSAVLRFAESGGVWDSIFGNRQERWLTSVRNDLRDWGFNTIGWTQEVVARHRDHSPPWRQADYARAGLPYCHLIRFTEMEMWNRLARFPDVFSDEFADWCDALARDFFGTDGFAAWIEELLAE